LSSHHHCMCRHHWCLLQHIYENQVNNDNVHQGPRKLSLMIWISTCHRVWWRKRWETSFWTCVPLSKVTITTIPQNVSWVVIHSFP
jgi:hypothetical protein